MAMAFIVGKQIELSGSSSAYDLKRLWSEGNVEQVTEHQRSIAEVENRVTGVAAQYEADMAMQTAAVTMLQEQMTMMAQNQQTLLEKLGVGSTPSENGSAPVQEGVNNGAQAPVPTP